MRMLLTWLSRFAGIVGVLVIAVAVVGRLAGAYWLHGFQVGTVLQGGMASTLLGCLGYGAVLAEWPKS